MVVYPQKSTKEHPMEIPRYELARTVTIRGHSFSGHPTTLHLHPHHQPGWYVRLPGCDPIPLGGHNLVPNTRSLDFVHGRARIGIMEHLLALRHRVDGVILEAPDLRLPYGTLSIYWNPVKVALRQNGALVPRVFSDSASIKKGDRSVRWVQNPGNTRVPGLTLDITIDYPTPWLNDLTWHIAGRRVWDNTRDRLDDFSHARSLGHPRWLEGVSALASLCRWPHHSKILWPRYRGLNLERLNNVIDEILRHRAVDILGGISNLIHPGTYLTGTFVSQKGGHWFDWGLTKTLLDPFQIHNYDEL